MSPPPTKGENGKVFCFFGAFAAFVCVFRFWINVPPAPRKGMRAGPIWRELAYDFFLPRRKRKIPAPRTTAAAGMIQRSGERGADD